MTTSTDHIEVATSALTAELLEADWADVRAAAAAEAVLLAAISPSDRPAAELPDYEPTADELLAVELLNDTDIDDLIAAINTRCAYEADHRHTAPPNPTGALRAPAPNLERAA
jgi:hypothetical protein